MSKLTIVANFVIKKDKIEPVKNAFLELVELTRSNDEGCISYNLHQDNDDQTKFTIIC